MVDVAANPSGPTAVAAAIMDYLYTIRSVQFSLIAATPMLVPEFTQLPDDRGHFAIPYLPYVLRGYRNRPPVYVQDILEDRDPCGPLPPQVKGVVVVSN